MAFALVKDACCTATTGRKMQGAGYSERQTSLSVWSMQVETETAAVQAIKVLNMIKVYGKPIRVNKASQDKKTMDVGSNLFIGNIDPDVDEKVSLLMTVFPDLCTHTSL